MSNVDTTSLFNIGYGLYVVTSNDGVKDNGLIVNTVMQATSNPIKVTVTINKDNYSHDVIKRTGKMNVNCLTVNAPFSIFERFGFQSGRVANKFDGFLCDRSENGLAVLKDNINSFMSLDVVEYYDMGTHGTFVCLVSEAKVINKDESMTYSYYHKNVKPKPQAQVKKGYVCKICGYIHQGELTPDFTCPLCKHGAIDFEEIK